MICLSVHDLSINFGGLRAVDRVGFAIETGQIHGLIGPNGAGKTTIFNCVTGFYRPTSGRIRFRDQDITNFRRDQVARLGIARTFQNVQLCPSLSVLDNVRLRLSGLYLAMATLGFTLIVQEMMLQLAVITHGSEGMHVQPASLLELTFDTDYRKYYLVLVVTVAMLLVARNLVSGRTTTSARRRPWA